MATKKEPNIDIWASLQRQHEEFNKRCPIIKTRYYVYEHTPADEDDYGSYVSERNNLVSPYFETVVEAEQWMDGYDPAPGTTFKIGSQNLRRYVEERWGV